MKPAGRISNANVRLCTRLGAVAITTFLAPLALAGDAAAERQPFTLFMGADLSLEQGKSFYRVVDVTGSYFQIHVNGKEVLVPTEKGTSRMRIDNGLKLGGPGAVIDGLDAERVFTPGRDPVRRFNRNAGNASGADAANDLTTSAYRTTQFGLAVASLDPHAGAAPVAAAQAAFDNASAAQSQSYLDSGSDLNSAGAQANDLQVELAKEDYDAINISMDLSSPVPLDDPYILVVARIHERDEKPDVFRNWIYAEKIDPIGEKPRKINVRRGGFPVGYKLEECQVRIYNHGREVATNESPKRVDLTREQAQQYVLIEHLAANKDATMPALPVLCQAPPDLKQRIAAGEYSQACFVKVDADGNPGGIFADRECTHAVDDPYVQAIVSSGLFTPALEKGRPVNGVARLQLSALLN